MDEPRWVTRLMADAMHFDQIREHGGLPGISDENALESALARARNQWLYAQHTDQRTEQPADLPALGAAYGYGLATSHGYRDGNKRIAFLAMYTFLALNGLEIDAAETELVQLMWDVASNECDEATLAAWVRSHVVPFV